MSYVLKLREAIKALPAKVSRDSDGGVPIPVMRYWTTRLPLRHQGVLVTSIRGCDGSHKEDPSKALTRMVRRAILNPHDPRESENPGGFFGMNRDTLEHTVISFLHSLDEYPLHYITHLMHSCQIIGYYHPFTAYRQFFVTVYFMMVDRFHLRPETQDDMNARLTEDRVAKGTVSTDFPEYEADLSLKAQCNG